MSFMCPSGVVEPDDVRRLIADGESLTCEFKRSSINDNEVVETAVCLANGSGGYLLLGVEDDRKLTGTNDGRGRRRRAVEATTNGTGGRPGISRREPRCALRASQVAVTPPGLQPSMSSARLAERLVNARQELSQQPLREIGVVEDLGGQV